jgi:putative transcriptional regulator
MKSKKRRSQNLRGKAAGQRILESLTEIRDAVTSGRPLRESLNVREVKVTEPSPHDAASVRQIRGDLHMSQGVFAQLLGVSAKLVQSWEIGTRAPSPLARRLLDEMKRDPKRWRSLLRRSA